jgi:hypothetical protein
LQAQDLRAARLALRARVKGLTIADVDRALTEDRSFVVTWVNRGTLHFVHRDDVDWLVKLTGPTQETAVMRRLAQEGVSPGDADRAVALMGQALATDGPLTRPQLGEIFAAAGLRTEGQALIHLLFMACYRGVAVRGPVIGRQHAYVRTEDWLGVSRPVDRDAALAELARRYLGAFGPATDTDLAYWSGLPKRDARAGLEAIAGELTEHAGGLVDLRRRREAPARSGAKLLGLWDNYLLGWKDRTFQIAPENTVAVYANGMIGPAAARGGWIVGRWSAKGGGVQLLPFEDDARGFAAESRAVERFLAGG